MLSAVRFIGVADVKLVFVTDLLYMTELAPAPTPETFGAKAGVHISMSGHTHRGSARQFHEEKKKRGSDALPGPGKMPVKLVMGNEVDELVKPLFW